MCRGEADRSSSTETQQRNNNSNGKGGVCGISSSSTTSIDDVTKTKDNYKQGRAHDGTVINGSLRPKQQQSNNDDNDKQPEQVLLYVGIEGRWYDATKFAKHHPGGDIIHEFHNRDATAQFLAYHDRTILNKYKLKVLDRYPYDKERPGGSSFQGAWMRLNDKFEKEGRYQTPISFLVSRIAILIGLFLVMMTMIRWYNNNNWDSDNDHACIIGIYLSFVIGAACMAAIWQQAGFLMHDTMHNHILHNRKGDQRLGFIFGNVLLGVSGRWWRDEHNEHHIFTNTIIDGVGPADPQMVEDVWIQDERLIPYFVQCMVKFMLDYQQFYFVPVLLIVGLFPIKIDAITHTDRYLSDITGLALHICWVGAVLSLLPSNMERVCFYVIANFFSGCLAIQLLVSHYAKPWVEKDDTKDAGSWAGRQVEAVMDITCPTWLDWFHGGLHIHSVHHMFPRMCRCHYRAVYDEIIATCDQHGITLDRFSWFDAIARCVHHFSTIKDKAAAAKVKAE